MLGSEGILTTANDPGGRGGRTCSWPPALVVYSLPLPQTLSCYWQLNHGNPSSQYDVDMHYANWSFSVMHYMRESIALRVVACMCLGSVAQCLSCDQMLILQALVNWRGGEPARECFGDFESALGLQHHVSQGRLLLSELTLFCDFTDNDNS